MITHITGGLILFVVVLFIQWRISIVVKVVAAHRKHLANLDKHFEAVDKHLAAHDKHIDAHDRMLKIPHA